MTKGKNVNYLVCVNKEDYSKVALRFACYVAKRSNGTVNILHVIEPADYNTLGMVAEKMQQEKHEEAEKLLDDLGKHVQKWLGKVPVVIFREGFIEDEIVKLIKKDKSIDILVAGCASDSAPKSKVLPPIVSQVGSKLKIPMLIVPGNLSKKDIKDLTD